MLETFGARLRQRREQQGIELRTIADQTKIKLSLLEALERDDVSQWPSGIFRRAYMRTYAKAIGLDPDDAVREFLGVHPEAHDVAAIAEIASLADGTRANGGPPTRLRNIMGSALGSFSWLRRGQATEETLVADMPDATALRERAGPSVGDELHFIGIPPTPSRVEAEAEVVAAYEPEDIGDQDQAPEPIAESAEQVLLEEAPAAEPEPPRTTMTEPDAGLMAVAQLCTAFGRIATADDVRTLLAEAAHMLDASGLIVWMWDPSADGLRPAIAHGYSDRVLAQLPTVRCDADNATAAAFRSAETCVIAGGDAANGALVVPMLTADGCAGVLAIELRGRAEQREFVRATATILAALMTQFAGCSRAVGGPEAELPAPAVDQMPAPRLRASAGR